VGNETFRGMVREDSVLYHYFDGMLNGI
jgi:hypothetical protein